MQVSYHIVTHCLPSILDNGGLVQTKVPTMPDPHCRYSLACIYMRPPVKKRQFGIKSTEMTKRHGVLLTHID